jgi:hypothetical protein
MVNRYYVSGGSGYNDILSWSNVSGGSGGFSVPDSNTDIILDVNSPSITLLNNITINSISTIGYLGNFDSNGFSITSESNITFDFVGNLILGSDLIINGNGQLFISDKMSTITSGNTDLFLLGINTFRLDRADFVCRDLSIAQNGMTILSTSVSVGWCNIVNKLYTGAYTVSATSDVGGSFYLGIVITEQTDPFVCNGTTFDKELNVTVYGLLIYFLQNSNPLTVNFPAPTVIRSTWMIDLYAVAAPLTTIKQVGDFTFASLFVGTYQTGSPIDMTIIYDTDGYLFEGQLFADNIGGTGNTQTIVNFSKNSELIIYGHGLGFRFGDNSGSVTFNFTNNIMYLTAANFGGNDQGTIYQHCIANFTLPITIYKNIYENEQSEAFHFNADSNDCSNVIINIGSGGSLNGIRFNDDVTVKRLIIKDTIPIYSNTSAKVTILEYINGDFNGIDENHRTYIRDIKLNLISIIRISNCSLLNCDASYGNTIIAWDGTNLNGGGNSNNIIFSHVSPTINVYFNWNGH